MYTVIHVPSAAQALSLMADKRFLSAVDATLSQINTLCVRMGWGGLLESRYLRLRYKEGWLVKEIQAELHLTRHHMYELGVGAHWYLRRCLSVQAPHLAQRLGTDFGEDGIAV